MTRADRLVIAAACLLLGALYARFWGPSEPATGLEVRAADGSLQQLELDQARELRVAGRYGESLIQIDHGRARFLSSPCHGKLCVHYGWLQHSGETAACLPNGVLITLTGGERRYDAINL